LEEESHIVVCGVEIGACELRGKERGRGEERRGRKMSVEYLSGIVVGLGVAVDVCHISELKVVGPVFMV